MNANNPDEMARLIDKIVAEWYADTERHPHTMPARLTDALAEGIIKAISPA